MTTSAPGVLGDVLADLAAESADLDALVTPLAAADPEAFGGVLEQAAAAFTTGEPLVDRLAADRAADPDLPATWRAGRHGRDFAYALNARPRPEEPVRVELVGPSGDLWAWGSEDASQRVTAPGQFA